MLNNVKAMDPAAWQRFVLLYGPLVYRWCRQADLQEADALDVGQNVFATVARAIGRFRKEQSGGTFRGWMWTITRNKIRDFVRRAPPGTEGVGGDDALAEINAIPADVPPDPQDESLLLRRAVELILTDFEPETGQAFMRVVIGGESPANVAHALGITVNAVYLAKARVKKRLRTEFEGLIDL